MYGNTEDPKATVNKNKVGGITCSDLKPRYKAAVIRTVQCWYKQPRSTEQNRSPGRGGGTAARACVWGQLLYNKGAKNVQRAEDGLSNKCYRENGMHMQKSETGPLSFATYKNELKVD